MSVEKIIDAFATIQARTEDAVEDNADRYKDRVDELLNDPTERLPSIWFDHLSQYAADHAELSNLYLYTLEDLAELPYRPPELVAAFWTAARVQATTELNAERVISGAEKIYLGVQALAQTLPKSTVKEAAEKGVSKDEVKMRRTNGKP